MKLSNALKSAFRMPKYEYYDPTKKGIARYVNYTSQKGRWNFFWVIVSFWTSIIVVAKKTADPPKVVDQKQTQEFLAQLK